MKNPDKRGGKGMLPACCLPLWGREGFPSWLPQRISELQEKEDFNKAVFIIIVVSKTGASLLYHDPHVRKWWTRNPGYNHLVVMDG
jgi:hypothetical protein